jgi:capsular polysaccharide biosynthesis protein
VTQRASQVSRSSGVRGGRPTFVQDKPKAKVPQSAVVQQRSSGAGRWATATLALVLAAVFLLPPAGAAAWSAAQRPTYAVEVDLLYEASDRSTVDSIERELATNRVLLLRRALIGEAAESVGRDPQQLREDVSVEVVEASSVLRLRVLDPDAQRARAAAQYLVDRHLASAGELPALSDFGRLRVVAAPSVLEEPVAPQPLRAAAAGALLGLVLALALLLLFRFRHGWSRPSGS